MHYLLKHNMLTHSSKRITEDKSIMIVTTEAYIINAMVNSHFFYYNVHFEYLKFENSMTRDLDCMRLVTHYIDQKHFNNSMIKNVCIQVCKN